MIEISIIVPVYNVEKYLEECILSLVEQKYINYEIILIDDGSTDLSGNICELYSKKFSHISSFYQENRGVSSARNFGIRMARGKYILFVDADDFIEKNSLDNICKVILENENVDFIFLNAYKFFNNNNIMILDKGFEKEKIFKKTAKDVIGFLAKLEKYPGSACAKLIKREMIIKNNIFFDENKRIGEDLDWTLRVFLVAKEFNYCRGKYYYYRQYREGSASNFFLKSNFDDLLGLIEKWCSLGKNNNLFKLEIFSFIAYEYVILLSYFIKLDHREREKYVCRIYRLSFLLRFKNSIKIRFVRYVYKCFGLYVTSFALHYYLKYRELINK